MLLSVVPYWSASKQQSSEPQKPAAAAAEAGDNCSSVAGCTGGYEQECGSDKRRCYLHASKLTTSISLGTPAARQQLVLLVLTGLQYLVRKPWLAREGLRNGQRG